MASLYERNGRTTSQSKLKAGACIGPRSQRARLSEYVFVDAKGRRIVENSVTGCGVPHLDRSNAGINHERHVDETNREET